jgi:hypothetical protein
MRIKRQFSFSVAGQPAKVVTEALLRALAVQPGGRVAELELACGTKLNMDVVSTLPLLSLSAANVAGVNALTLSLCISDCILGNSAINNSAAVSLEIIANGGASTRLQPAPVSRRFSDCSILTSPHRRV